MSILAMAEDENNNAIIKPKLYWKLKIKMHSESPYITIDCGSIHMDSVLFAEHSELYSKFFFSMKKKTDWQKIIDIRWD